MELTYFTDEVNSVKWRSGTARLYSVTSQHFHPLLAQIYTNVRAYIIYREFLFGILGVSTYLRHVLGAGIV